MQLARLSGNHRRVGFRILRRLLPLVGIALLVRVIRQIDGDAAWEALGRLPSAFLLLAAALFGANLILKAIRWLTMLRSQGILLRWTPVSVSYFSALLYGAVTVGRVGELLRAGVVVRSGRSLGTAVSSILFDRVLDVAFLALLAVTLGLVALGQPLAGALLGALLLAGGMFGAERLSGPGGSGAGGVRSRIACVLRAVSRVVPRAINPSGGGDFLRGVQALLRRRALGRALAWTASAWVLYLGSVWVLAYGIFSAPPSAGFLALATSLSALSTILPISIHGLGVREVVFARILALDGVPAAEAVALSLTSFVVMLSVSVLIGGTAALGDALFPGAPEHPLGER